MQGISMGIDKGLCAIERCEFTAVAQGRYYVLGKALVVSTAAAIEGNSFFIVNRNKKGGTALMLFLTL
jgi:hypothetical protein